MQSRTLTCVVSTRTAHVAHGLSTRDARLDGDPVTLLPLCDTFSDLDDLAGRLVARSVLVSDDHVWSDVTVLPEVYVGAVVRFVRGGEQADLQEMQSVLNPAKRIAERAPQQGCRRPYSSSAEEPHLGDLDEVQSVDEADSPSSSPSRDTSSFTHPQMPVAFTCTMHSPGPGLGVGFWMRWTSCFGLYAQAMFAFLSGCSPSLSTWNSGLL